MATPAERGPEPPTVRRVAAAASAERDAAAAAPVENSMDEEKSMEGGGCRPQPQSAPGESAATVGERSLLAGSSWPWLPGIGAPTCHGLTNFTQVEGRGGTRWWLGGRAEIHVSGTRDDGAYTPGWLRGANRRYECVGPGSGLKKLSQLKLAPA